MGRVDEIEDQEEMKFYEIEAIDLVIVDLYPFEDTVKNGASHADIIEKIDIGGISLIRAAAKNYKSVLIVSNKNQYQRALEVIKKGYTTEEERQLFAKEAFMTSSHYDTQIWNYFGGDYQESLKVR